jgi:threonyl-tRNA synthetase
MANTGFEKFKDQLNGDNPVVALKIPAKITSEDPKAQPLVFDLATDLSGDLPLTLSKLVGGSLDTLKAVKESDIEPVYLNDAEGITILRHSTTHIMAQAVQKVFPGTGLGIGPVITDGFYYDFDTAGTPDHPAFTPEDFSKIEKEMLNIVNQNQRFKRREISIDEGKTQFKDERFKLELIDKKSEIAQDEESGAPSKLSATGASTEVGLGELTVYDQYIVTREKTDESGNVTAPSEEKFCWSDLCKGPHLPNTKLIAKNFKLLRSSAAYWLGNDKNPPLQRLYGTAWPTKDELKDYLFRIEEAKKRDHRVLGQEMDLFSFPDEIGSGLAVFHPKGGLVRMVMEEYSRKKHLEAGYSFVNTPHITKGKLFEMSGHLAWYKDGMFPPMVLDEKRDEKTGEITHQGEEYYLKPMNCPFHTLIYRSSLRSYKQLPLRLFEFGTVYRYEKSGVIHGLTRVRGLTQDDAHIYCTREQMKDELTSILQFVLDLLKDYGLDDFYLELSTKDPNKYVGSDEIWEESTRTLQEVAEASGLELVADPEGAAFYGPKISVQARDALGRTWQMSTIQLDFNTPARFDIAYTASSGERVTPVMIHRALFGSIERFFGVLTEHYGGVFPVWLAPVQVLAVPVAEEFEEYLDTILDDLKKQGVRVELDNSNDRFPKKIRNASKSKVPFILIAGDEDRANGAVSFRYRDGRQDNGVKIEDAKKIILDAIASHSAV